MSFSASRGPQDVALSNHLLSGLKFLEKILAAGRIFLRYSGPHTLDTLLQMPHLPSENNVSVKRYIDVANSLVKEIVDGHYVIGSLLPTEHELAGQFGASRHTVRAALALLQDRGYISRKKAVGSRVESSNPTASYTQSVETLEDLVRVAATEVRSLKSIQPIILDRPTARRLGAPVGSDWILFTGPRVDVRRQMPVSWANIYIDAAFSKIIERVEANPQMLISSMIERECGQTIAEIRQTISGTLIDEGLAEELHTQAGSAGLRILRHYKDASNRILEITETIYPADRVSISFQLKRNRGSVGST